ncbi:uncharacterized protein N7484_010922 [Penicillium longicatenatum]|uniref:uncharacterized protein n=1 Tax=Penicillium longicatenatum TaxID=1561947 RepID=UPI0025479146|nr:uncharacterized protein N7484_010922 [Penicillium longicatenatum]KAJ5630822.1 hypothetical protein N7484_010922 [Penicillium longicatenatum]
MRHNQALRLTGCIAAAAVLAMLYTFGVPQLARFRFRSDLPPYDWGVYGAAPSRSYLSCNLTTPRLEILQWDSRCDSGFTFLAPRGFSVAKPSLLILDAQGEPVWVDYSWGEVQDFKVQQFKGKDYLTFWAGVEIDIHGQGSWYMLNTSYQIQYRISPMGKILSGDLHEFQITDNDTALVTIYDSIPFDLSAVGGPSSGWIYDGLFQEIDIMTGELLFEWRASEHYPINSTFWPMVGGDISKPFDAFHINSVDKDAQGNYLVSMRHTYTVSNIDGKTGAVLWTLGGRLNDFTDVADSGATDFSWQHDARWWGNNTITLLNNAAREYDSPGPYSYGMSIQLDVEARHATLQTIFSDSQKVLATSQGNLQVLENGNIFVGWGHSAAFTEFTPEGEILCDVHFGASAYYSFGRIVSYRILKGTWSGLPLTEPKAKIIGDGVYVSWNGATEVWEWQLKVSDQSQSENPTFSTLGKARKIGFETRISAPNINQYREFRVAALDAHGMVLGETETIKTEAIPIGNISNFQILLTATLISSACLAFWGFWKRYGSYRTWLWKYKTYHIVH